MPTQTQMRMMTAEYAAPEQIRGEEITPATDVYSLGVLLYELLTGARPYKFPSRAPYEIARVICEEEPLPLSSAISSYSPESNSTTGKQRTPSKDPLAISDSLEKIVLKSLQKKPSNRYQSVGNFPPTLNGF
jgi:serine/threonine-protein kinase